MLFFSEGFTFRNFLTDAFAIFMFVLWFWLLIIVIGDLFRRHDITGWGKAIWVIALIVFPYISIFAYMITQSRGMAERGSQQAQQAREELRKVVGYSVADEIDKLDRRDRSLIRSSRACADCIPPATLAKIKLQPCGEVFVPAPRRASPSLGTRRRKAREERSASEQSRPKARP